MLKTFEFIRSFEVIMNKLRGDNAIGNFSVELQLTQEIVVHIVSDDISDIDQLVSIVADKNAEPLLRHNKLIYEFITREQSETDAYAYLFEASNNVHLGLRRSLQNLVEPFESKVTNKTIPLVTFFSYKGGVGRTTSLALFSSYYAQQGKNVFVLDCDFEAPGLVNFFNIDQFENPKSGVIEYLIDKKFDANDVLLNDYVYEVSTAFSGEGQINLMAAGNIFGDDRRDFLEGLSRVDTHGASAFLSEFSALIANISQQYKPDVILVDSRTGFNNIFGCLSQLSDIVVALAGDNIQNRPGIEFLLERFSSIDRQVELVLVLSIISTSVTKRFERFNKVVHEFAQEYRITETEQSAQILPDLKTFCFPREAMLEMIGTGMEDVEDFQYFAAKNTNSSYHGFLEYIEAQLAEKSTALVTANGQDDDAVTHHSDQGNDQLNENLLQQNDNCVTDGSEFSDDDNFDHEVDADQAIVTSLPSSTDRSIDKLPNQDVILTRLKDNMPEAYAENEQFEELFFTKSFYIRQCMQDLFLPAHKIILGGKGTGKTTLYRALQNQSFFDVLIKKSQKSHLHFSIASMVTIEKNSAGFIDFSAQLGDKLQDEVFVNRLWVVYIWATLFNQQQTSIKPSFALFSISNDAKTARHLEAMVSNDEHFIAIEEDLAAIDLEYKRADKRLIITFDRLDEMIKPVDWNKGIAPLIRYMQNNTWQNIHPKLFLRRDLYNKLGNITNKNALEKHTISLEWSHNEMYAFFFKVVFAHAKAEFIAYLNTKKEILTASFIKENIERPLQMKNHYNQLAAEEYVLKPLVIAFFGSGQYAKNNAYEALYYNLRNANNTISLRPFLDLIRYAIEEQIRDPKYRRGSILGLDYCFYKSVRAKAVERHFDDLATEEGNDVIRFFIQDIKDSNISTELKYSSLMQSAFERLVKEVKANHEVELKNISVATFEEMLVLNGIMFVSTIAGNRKRYSFAFLYKYYLDLKTPRDLHRR